MTPATDVVLNSSQDEINAARQETTKLNTELVELGKVSETQGGIGGSKTEPSIGFQWF